LIREEKNLVPSTRTTVRLPEEILKALKEKASKNDASLNSIITKILRKNVIFDMRMNALPSITMSQALFSTIFDKLTTTEKEEVVNRGLQTIKNLFTVLNLEYNTENVLNEYFTILGKYCGWFTFHYDVDENHYRLVFEAELGHGWIEFLQFYVQKILQSLKVTIDNESIAESVLIIEFNT
jgi:hypothetical protein